MKKATITQTKNQLSALLDAVKQGESVLIMDRDKPVARLEPVVLSPGKSGDDMRLAGLERAGLVRRVKIKGPNAQILAMPVARAPGSASATRALLDEREEGR